jgi:hypothetical protein
MFYNVYIVLETQRKELFIDLSEGPAFSEVKKYHNILNIKDNCLSATWRSVELLLIRSRLCDVASIVHSKLVTLPEK